jgi:aspartate aminotransferase
VFVHKAASILPSESSPISLRIADLGTESAFAVGEDIARSVARGMDVIRMNIGEPDTDTAPHINEEAVAQLRRGNSHYVDPQGIPALRAAISRHMARTRGLEVHPDRIVVTAGGKPPIGYAMQAYVNPGDEVIYPSPGFPMYESWTTYVGAIPVPLQLSEADGFAFTPDQLAALITPRTKLIILCSPSNPTGGVLSAPVLADVAAVIRERCGPEVRILSDEIYEHILFDGAVHRSIASEPGMEARTVIASGHSKGFAMTGWRLGYAVLPSAEEARIFKQLNINTVSCVPPFIQEAGRVALESPESEPFVARMVAAFRDRRDWIVPALNAIPGVSCQTPLGAFYVFPNVAGLCERLGVFDAFDKLPQDIARRTSPTKLLQLFLLYCYGVATIDRRAFGTIGAEGQHYLRISIATPMDRLEEGVARIATAAGDTLGFAAFVREPEAMR